MPGDPRDWGTALRLRVSRERASCSSITSFYVRDSGNPSSRMSYTSRIPKSPCQRTKSTHSSASARSQQQWLQREGFMAPRQLYTFRVQQDLAAGSFLTFSIAGTSQYPLTDLPSWVPDLSQASTPLNTTLYHEPGRFSAGSSQTAAYVFSPDGNELCMHGVLLNYIPACSLPGLHPPTPGSNRLALQDLLTRWVNPTDADSFIFMSLAARSATHLVT